MKESRHSCLVPKPVVLTTSQRKRKCGLESVQREMRRAKLVPEPCGAMKPTDVGANSRTQEGYPGNEHSLAAAYQATTTSSVFPPDPSEAGDLGTEKAEIRVSILSL